MKPLTIDETHQTPRVCLDGRIGVLKITGRSLIEDAVSFYKPVVAWVQEYALNPNLSTEFEFRFEYINMESSKFMLNVISPLRNIEGVNIIWYYQSENDAMKEMGEDLSELLGIPFTYKVK